jgi:signal peptidase II
MLQPKKTMRYFLVLFVLVVNIGCDQISKTVVRKHIATDERITFFNEHLVLTKVENSGAFLSMGDSLPNAAKSLLLMVLPMVVMGLGLAYVLLKPLLSHTSVLGICCILGGGVGNLYDRFLYRSVTDFLHLDFGIFRTGIFNVADMSILLGIALLLVDQYLQRKVSSIKTDTL